MEDTTAILGEDCGEVNIYNNLKVYAYGGSGSNTVPSQNYGTNSGASGYPAAGIGRRRSWPVVGGDWANGAGGYVGTWGDNGDSKRVNGNNGVSLLKSDFGNVSSWGDDGASYFSFGFRNTISSSWEAVAEVSKPQIGGQGGILAGNISNYGLFASSSGGKAGNGGTITVSSNAQVYAFNGDRITDGNYDVTIYDYDKSGQKLEKTCDVIEKYGVLDDEGNPVKICPIKIFAQDGLLREVRYSNICWGEKPTSGWDYFYGIFGEQLEPDVKNIMKATDYFDVDNVLLRKEQTTSKTNYINPQTNDCYGVGSGAGYMEVSNGTYTINPDFN